LRSDGREQIHVAADFECSEEPAAHREDETMELFFFALSGAGEEHLCCVHRSSQENLTSTP
jgi:hypothetical protein